VLEKPELRVTSGLDMKQIDPRPALEVIADG